VLAVVDGEFQQRCVEEIRRLHDEGRTVIFVSHNLDQVANVCDRVVWLERGLVRQLGDAHSVIEAYRNVGRDERR
jgi:ABC-2 type transport system ATP-binding protein/lipopolysaccharide transport system ATP-binding protein